MDFDLLSNDWSNISLLHGEHLTAETLYAEQLHRWGLQHGRNWGIVYMRADDLSVSGSSDDYEVALQYCKAITRGGYIVEIGADQPPIKVAAGNDKHGANTRVPVYLGVGVVKTRSNAGSSQTGALLDRPTLRWDYKLATEADDPNRDWIQIGRMAKSGTAFVLDLRYIPQCVHLRSHPVLYRMAGEIVKAAATALSNLQAASRAKTDDVGGQLGNDYYALLAAAVSTIAPSAVLLDWDIHPRAYLERLVAMLYACNTLIPVLPKKDMAWEDAQRKIQAALDEVQVATPDGYPSSFGRLNLPAGDQAFAQDPASSSTYNGSAFDPEAARPTRYWWEAFEKVRIACEAIAVVFGDLVPRAGAAREQQPRGGTIITKPDPFKQKDNWR